MTDNAWIAHRYSNDGQLITLFPLTFGRVRIGIGEDDTSIRDMW